MAILGWILLAAFVAGVVLFLIAAAKVAGDADALDQRRRDYADGFETSFHSQTIAPERTHDHGGR